MLDKAGADEYVERETCFYLNNTKPVRFTTWLKQTVHLKLKSPNPSVRYKFIQRCRTKAQKQNYINLKQG